jgi:hypothetical protein
MVIKKILFQNYTLHTEKRILRKSKNALSPTKPFPFALSLNWKVKKSCLPLPQGESGAAFPFRKLKWGKRKMIPNQWYAVLSSKEVKKGHLYGVTRLGEKMVFYRGQGKIIHCLADRTILHQDRRVVLTQLPKMSELVMGENLVQGDAPIIAFRQKREELRKQAIKKEPVHS